MKYPPCECHRKSARSDIRRKAQRIGKNLPLSLVLHSQVSVSRHEFQRLFWGLTKARLGLDSSWVRMQGTLITSSALACKFTACPAIDERIATMVASPWLQTRGDGSSKP